MAKGKEKRSVKTKNLVLTNRDRDILRTVYRFDGMMGIDQIERVFFESPYRARIRLSELCLSGYLARFEERRQVLSLPQVVYWLGRRGAETVAGEMGISIKDKSFHWRVAPRESLIAHDLKINDVRIAVEEACEETDYLELIEWVSSGMFWRSPDPVTYKKADGKEAKRMVRPDGYFVVANQKIGKPLRFLLELDHQGSEDLGRIAEDKILPGIYYLASDAYLARTGGVKFGRWLFVVASKNPKLRLANLKRRTETVSKKENASRFWFATFDDVVGCPNVLTNPIWQKGGEHELFSLVRDTFD